MTVVSIVLTPWSGNYELVPDQLVALEAMTHADYDVVMVAEDWNVGKARNTAVSLATGDYVWFLDPDDRFTYDYLSGLVEEAGRWTRPDIVVGPYRHVVQGSPRAVHSVWPQVYDQTAAVQALFDGQLTGHLWNKLFRREVLARHPFEETMPCFSDLAGVIDLLADIDSVVTSDRGWYEYHSGNPNSLSGSASVQERTQAMNVCLRKAADLASLLNIQSQPRWGAAHGHSHTSPEGARPALGYRAE